ncbi:MAG: AAA family ATPase [Acidobacteriota bacterium]
MTLTRLELKSFTAFEDLTLDLAPGLNIFLGANATGKTHLLKVSYAACAVSKTRGSFADKLVRLFLPSGDSLGRLVHRQRGVSRSSVTVQRNGKRLQAAFHTKIRLATSAEESGLEAWAKEPLECVYIPVKEMLANAPGFRALYGNRDVHFEEIYADILDRAFRPVLRGQPEATRRKLLQTIREAIDGRVVVEDEEFFLQNASGKLEFTLVAEGFRKLALLWLLIQNGTLLDGSVLCWDEPEANLNPRLLGTVVEILLELQTLGVQILVATHDYVFLKELDLRAAAHHSLRYHALHRSSDGQVRHEAADSLLDIDHNAIAQTFDDLIQRDIARSLERRA